MNTPMHACINGSPLHAVLSEHQFSLLRIIPNYLGGRELVLEISPSGDKYCT